MDEVKLAKKAMHGNVNAYGQLIEIHKVYLYRTAYLYVKNEDAALDIVSECVVKAFSSIKNMKEPQYFKTWLTKILINVSKDYFRSHREQVPYDDLPLCAPEGDVSLEEKWDLYAAIDILPEKYKNVIMLKYFDDLKVSEIAEILDLPEGSVKAYLSRGREELRKYLKEDYIYVQ